MPIPIIILAAVAGAGAGAFSASVAYKESQKTQQALISLDHAQLCSENTISCAVDAMDNFTQSLAGQISIVVVVLIGGYLMFKKGT